MRASVNVDPFPNVDLGGSDHRYFNAGELERLIALIAIPQPRTVVEFGVNEGRAARAILRNVPSIERYVGVDVFPGYLPHMPCQRKEVPIRPGCLVDKDPRFRLILRNRGSFDLGWRELPRCEAVFIDADHSRVGVLNDYALASAIVRPGGIVVFHDDNHRPVVQVSETLDELAESGVEVFHVGGTWLAYTRA